MTADGNWFTVGTTDPTVVLATVRAVRSSNPDERNHALLHLAQQDRFDAFLTACREQPGEPRLWATLVLHIRAMRAQPAMYASDAAPAERVIAAADGLQRAVAGEVELGAAGRGLAAMLAAILPVLRGSGAPQPLVDALDQDLATVTADIDEMLLHRGVDSLPHTG